MECKDVEKFVHPYVDGEFAADDQALFDRHLATCVRCRELVAFQTTFKANLRARLRRTPGSPELRDVLARQVTKALDRADARGEGPVPRIWRKAAAASTVIVAAAAILLFLGFRQKTHADDSPIVEGAVRGHVMNLPVEVGGSDDNVKAWMERKVPVPVRPPHLRRGTVRVSFIGGRLFHLRDRDAAQLTYR